MAGTLEISEEMCWMPAGWVFDKVLEDIASALIVVAEESLSDSLLRSRTHENGGYLDLQSYDTNRITKLIQAADNAYSKAESEGASSFVDPKFFPGFLNQFQKLREMLRTRQQELITSSKIPTRPNPTGFGSPLC